MLLHVPVVAVSVRPRVALPLTVGADTDSGTGRDRIASGALLAVALCPGVVAVATSATSWPTSSAASVYREPVPTGVPSRRHS